MLLLLLLPLKTLVLPPMKKNMRGFIRQRIGGSRSVARGWKDTFFFGNIELQQSVLCHASVPPHFFARLDAYCFLEEGASYASPLCNGI